MRSLRHGGGLLADDMTLVVICREAGLVAEMPLDIAAHAAGC